MPNAKDENPDSDYQFLDDEGETQSTPLSPIPEQDGSAVIIIKLLEEKNALQQQIAGLTKKIASLQPEEQPLKQLQDVTQQSREKASGTQLPPPTCSSRLLGLVIVIKK